MSENPSGRNVLLVDAWNLYMRSYAAYPSMSTNGVQTGGVVGFLKTVTHLVKMFSPNIVYVIWESGGSSRRRHLFHDYKRGVRPEKLNRYYEDDIPDTAENKVYQVSLLARLLRCLPLCQVYVPDCEGDDVIAYMTTYVQGNKIIVSTDRDYYQLLRGDEVRIYNPTRKDMITEKDVMKEFNVSAHNFALAKSICGDAADNVPGIKGFGYKTISKKFPLLMSTGTVLMEDLISYAASRREESVFYKRIFEEADDVRRNWKLVYLDTSMLANYQVQKVNHAIDTFKPGLDKMKFVRLLNDEGVHGLDFEDICYSFVKLNNIS